MDQATAGLIGVGVGGTISAITAIVTSQLTTRNQLRLEKEKAEIARHDTLLKELRSSIAEVARDMLSAYHSMEWVSWYATKGSDLINDELISQYHKEIHNIIPRMLGSLAVVASIDRQAYEELTVLAHKLQQIEDRIAEAFIEYKRSPKESLNALARCHEDAFDLHKSLPLEFATIMMSCNRRFQT
jgi:gas vesicle protein